MGNYKILGGFARADNVSVNARGNLVVEYGQHLTEVICGFAIRTQTSAPDGYISINPGLDSATVYYYNLGTQGYVSVYWLVVGR